MEAVRAVVEFWCQAGPRRWFARDDAFDEAIRQRFGALLDPAREGRLDGWADTAEGVLALLLVLDQFPRNLHRGTPLAFASDAKAREVESGWDLLRGNSGGAHKYGAAWTPGPRRLDDQPLGFDGRLVSHAGCPCGQPDDQLPMRQSVDVRVVELAVDEHDRPVPPNGFAGGIAGELFAAA